MTSYLCILYISSLAFPAVVLLKTSSKWPQRHAVVASVRRPQQCVDVELCRLRITEEYTRVMVELDNDDRALNAVIERILVTEATNPCLLYTSPSPRDS